MNNQKAEDLLNLALDSTEEEREKSMDLQVGYEAEENTWELIIKYDQDKAVNRPELSEVIPLSFGFGIIKVKESEIAALLELQEVEYVEKPKRLYFAVNQAKRASCFSGLPQADFSGILNGEGTIVALIDSGVDYFHSDFRKEDGSTRILNIWDQTINAGNPPEGFRQGTEFNQEQINEALAQGERIEGYRLVPSMDNSGHGTAVLGIAAGNGNASGGMYAGAAPESDILVVKLGLPGENSFPSTTQLMQALEYVIRKAEEYGKPVAINLSFGNSYGSHTGTSLLETYMNSMAGVWKNVIAAGMGNEGAGYGHATGILQEDKIEMIELAVSEYEPSLNIQLWKNYEDEFEVILIHPSGQRITLEEQMRSGDAISENNGPGALRYRLGETELLVYYGVPTPYSVNQEIYIDFIPVGQRNDIDSGIWNIELTPKKIVSGRYDLWLPGAEVLNPGTRFLRSSSQTTLTIPATAEKVISVGAYDSNTRSYASFSGRGYTRYPEKKNRTWWHQG